MPGLTRRRRLTEVGAGPTARGGPGALFTAVLISLAAPLAGPQSAPAQTPFSVTVSVDPDSATVGDRLSFVVRVEREPGVTYSMPDVPTSIAPFEVLDSHLGEQEETEGLTVDERTYLIAAFETGALGIPQLEFPYVTAEGDTRVAFSDSLPVMIGSVLPEVREDEEAGPLDIKPPIELPRRIWPYLVLAAVVAAAAAALYFLRRWWTARARPLKQESEVEPVVPRTAAHVVAFERLAAIERENLVGRGDLVLFYVRVTEAVRYYLRDRFGVDAIDMTTGELKPAMRDASIDEAEVDWTARYLLHADLAKFAKHVPSAERALSDLAEARSFIERTRLRGVEAPTEPDEPAGPDASAQTEDDAPKLGEVSQ